MAIVTDPATLYASIWQQALSLNPQVAKYGIRTGTSSPTGSDTFVYYQLNRVTVDPAASGAGITIDMQKIASGQIESMLSRAVRVWFVYQRDLDTARPISPNIKAPAPTPQFGYTLEIKGQVWVITKIKTTSLDFVWECTATLAH